MADVPSRSDALRLLKQKSQSKRAPAQAEDWPVRGSSAVAPPPPPPLDEPMIATRGLVLPPKGGDVEGAKRYRNVLRWGCEEGGRECVPVRDESRCLCGHRLREHVKPEDAEKGSAAGPTLSCKNRNCKCKKFFYIVAEGAWILRCR
eukprot:5786654-Pyramimonas_sp.AAC.1